MSAIHGEDELLRGEDVTNLLLDRGPQAYVVTVAGLLRTGARKATAVADEARASIRLRLLTEARLARLRKRLASDAAPPRLIPCEPDLAHHVRVVGRVDGLAGFERLSAQLMTARLARDRPLWEILLVPGPGPGRTGIVFRAHHAILDGATGVTVLRTLLDDLQPDVQARPASTAGRPAASTDPRTGLRERLRAASRLPSTLPRTALLGPLGPERGTRFLSVDLAELRRGARSVGGTVNDALLVALAEAAMPLFDALAERSPAVLPVSVPVRLGARSDARGANQVGTMVVRLPVGTMPVADRMAVIAAQTRQSKERIRRSRPPWFVRTAAGARLVRAFMQRQRVIGALATNVPGPTTTLSLAGATLESAWPMPIIAGNVRLGLAAMSYAGTLFCSLHWDDAIGAAGRACADRVEAALHEIAELSRQP